MKAKAAYQQLIYSACLLYSRINLQTIMNHNPESPPGQRTRIDLQQNEELPSASNQLTATAIHKCPDEINPT
jgi:hypothetical protein